MNTTDMRREFEFNAYFLLSVFEDTVPEPCGWCTDESKCNDLDNTLELLEIPGFTFLGSGGSRASYLKDGFVYKIEYVLALGREYSWQRQEPNYNEFKHYLELSEKNLPEKWRIPVTDVVLENHDFPVIVMEYIEGDKATWEDFEDTPAHMEFLKTSGLHDIYEGNVIQSDGLLYAIDIAQ
jgi:hypothetical protein